MWYQPKARGAFCIRWTRLDTVYLLGVASSTYEMLEPEQVEPTSAQVKPYWWIESWSKARDRVVAAFAELIGTVTLLVALGLIYFVLRLMILVGMPADGIQFLEAVDFWAFKAVFITFAMAFVLEAILNAKSSLKGKS
jgi:hypothetical protein